MDVRRSISTKVWMDGWFEELKPDEKLLWLYFLTNPATNMLGIFEVSVKRMSTDMGMPTSRILTIMKDFERVRKAFYWFGSVFLPNWMRHQSMNPNMLKSAISIYEGLSNELKTKLKDNGFESFESLSKGLVMLPKIEIEIEDEIEEKYTMSFLDFINRFNEAKGSKFTAKDSKTRKQYEARIKDGYTNDQIISSLKSFMTDSYHKDSGLKYLTPEFMTRPDKIEKGLNISITKPITTGFPR